ncbi:DUF11 domain-containing protein [Ruminococcaceae bacterium OttesenSCG-928-A16]|nr:DUF11 domain-containing protein [Ruminococcaceae bacterium OttesenSCG-928-A16]
MLPAAVNAAEQTQTITLTPGTENLFAVMESMVPGEEVTDYFTLENTGKQTCTFYLQAQSATADDFGGDADSYSKSAELLSLLEMQVQLHNGGSTTLLYKGKANQQHPGQGSSPLIGTDVVLGVLAPGQKLIIEATVKVPPELDNSYEFTQAKFWWRFYSMAVNGPTPPTPPGPASSSTSSSPSSSSSSVSSTVDSTPIFLPPTQDTFLKTPSSTKVRPGELVDFALSGFHNNTGMAVDEFTLSDIIPQGLTFVSGSLPAFTGGAGLAYNIVYTTNKSGLRTLQAGIPATAPFTFSAPALAAGEYITTVSFEFGTVPADFALNDVLTLTFRVDLKPPANTLINRGMLFYSLNGARYNHESRTQGIEVYEQDDLTTVLDEFVPFAGLRSSWALVNLALTVVCTLFSLVLCIGWLQKRKQPNDDPESDNYDASTSNQQEPNPRRPFGLRLVAIILGVLSVIAFIITEDMRLPMQIVDHWTLLMCVIAVLQLLFIALNRHAQRRYNQKLEDTEEPPEE